MKLRCKYQKQIRFEAKWIINMNEKYDIIINIYFLKIYSEFKYT